MVVVVFGKQAYLQRTERTCDETFDLGNPKRGPPWARGGSGDCESGRGSSRSSSSSGGSDKEAVEILLSVLLLSIGEGFPSALMHASSRR
ncbi:hypothetical protein TWF696_004535 [Orbilia brochopaga]|uniref:Uncharacterized protein n=1 Tax=Orbilia brochopaga TaxID=3140254 RepID=A0AAV9VAB8_9PEZI